MVLSFPSIDFPTKCTSASKTSLVASGTVKVILDRFSLSICLFQKKRASKSIRQITVTIFKNAVKKGYLVVAMSLEDAKLVLNNLSQI